MKVKNVDDQCRVTHFKAPGILQSCPLVAHSVSRRDAAMIHPGMVQTLLQAPYCTGWIISHTKTVGLPNDKNSKTRLLLGSAPGQASPVRKAVG